VNRKHLRRLVDRYRVTDGKGFRLKHFDPADSADGLVDRARSEALLADGVQRLAALQRLLYAQDQWALLCVFQGMELAHNFLWRVVRALPTRGQIGIFNRSHYEEVLTVRIHPELLAHQHLPPSLTGKKLWQHRLEDIANFEHFLTRQGLVICKFCLNLSKDEQKRRFLARLDTPDKHWKFSAADIAERGYWDAYQAVYQEAIAATATEHAPWFVVPADHKWFTRLVVVEAMVAALEDLHLTPPRATAEQTALLDSARRQLEAESQSDAG